MTRRKIHSTRLIPYYAKASTTSRTWSKVSKIVCELTFGNQFFAFVVVHLTTLMLVFKLDFASPNFLTTKVRFLLHEILIPLDFLDSYKSACAGFAQKGLHDTVLSRGAACYTSV